MLVCVVPPPLSEIPPVPGQRLRPRPAHAVTRACAAALLAAALAACAAQPSTSTAADDQRALETRVTAILAPLVAAHEFSGAVVLARGSSVVFAAGYGAASHEAGVPFTPDTPSDGASLAKTLTAAGVWWLAHEGRLALDAEVRTYLPAYPHAGVTVRQLIGHSNGLPDSYEYFDAYIASGELRTTDGLLAVVARTRPAPSFTPGTRFEYSSLGYDVAARLISQVTSASFGDFLQDRFFGRLGMSASFVRPARFADWPGTRTLGYRWAGGGWERFDVFDGEAFSGGSNVYLSARDVSRWAQAFATGTAVPPAVLTQAQAWVTVGGRATPLTGLNWYCDDARERCYYTGDLNAFYAVAYWDRRRAESVAFVSNSTLPMWRRPALARALVHALTGRETPAPAPAPEFERWSGETYRTAAGTYLVPEVGTLTLRGDGTRLVLRVNDGPDMAAFVVAPGVMYVPGADYWMAFSGGRPPRTIHLRSVFLEASGRRTP